MRALGMSYRKHGTIFEIIVLPNHSSSSLSSSSEIAMVVILSD